MQHPERITSPEVEYAKAFQRTDTKTGPKALDAETMFKERTTMLRSVEKRLSPLMLKALEIKLAHEKEDLDKLIATEAKAEAERAKRRGVLDARFFKKKTLPI
jgi:hypothetical protein